MTTSDTLIIEPGRAERNYWATSGAIASSSTSSPGATSSVRYKQTVIGVAWAVIRPFLTMVVFTVIFGKLAKLPSDGAAPYAADGLRRHAALDSFRRRLSEASNSLVGNANLISKIYFPRLIVPAAAVVVSFVDFLITSASSCWSCCGIGFRRAGRFFAAGLRAAGLPGEPRPGAVDHRAQRQIPRLPLRHSVHRPVRPLCLAGRLSARGRAVDEWRLSIALNPVSA